MRRTILMAAAFLFAALPVIAQSNNTGKIHGHIQDPIGAPVTNAMVIISVDPSTKDPKYTFTSDANGDYKGDGIVAGTYAISVRKADTPKDKVLDQFVEVKIAAGADVTQDFDMTRAAYISKMTPEQKKQVEETRKKNADIMKENAGIKTLNANLLKARADNGLGKAGPCVDTAGKPVAGHSDAAKCTADGFKVNVPADDYAEAETLMQQSTVAKPDSAILWLELGAAESGLKKYPEAETSLKKAIDLDTAEKKPDPATIGTAYNLLGEVYANENKLSDATATYESAAKIDPTQAGMYYSNQAIILTRVNQPDAAAIAADKAIAADPKRPIPYYLKGQALINKATIDEKTGKIVPPPGCVEAYQKYLELAPNGPYSTEVKAVLAEVSTSVRTTYKAGKK